MTPPTVHHGRLDEYCQIVRKQGKRLRQRHIIVLSGSRDWCRSEVGTISDIGGAQWISADRQSGYGVLTSDKGKMLLGLETETLVFDAFSGFDPNTFGAVAGSVIAGGLIILLIPEVSRWAEFHDPVGERVAVYPFEITDLKGRYLVRLGRLFDACENISLWRENGDFRKEKPIGCRSCTEPSSTTADQYRSIAQIIQTVRGKPHSPLVMTGDRGRGKSAALGMAAAQLLRAGVSRVWLTAPRLENSKVIFRHCSALLPAASTSRNQVEYNQARFEFFAPDAVLQQKGKPDLLLVDEAAAIPTSLLREMLLHFPRIVFTTTVHGYEGNGRGFALRFKPFLDQQTPKWRHQVMTEPVRWSIDDPAEAFINQALLLDAAAATVPGSFKSVDDCIFSRLDRDELAYDEPRLKQVFGLLTEAHYQTTPMDLRHLLDGPNIDVWAAVYQGIVVATAMSAREGGFDAALSQQVFAGRRRPRGHLLPQLLAAQGDDPLAATRQCIRIIRIAVHPDLRRRGLGRRMLEKIAAGSENVDYIGASFAMEQSVVSFWKGCGFQPVNLGLTRHGVSGGHSVAFVLPVTAAGEAFISGARRNFIRLLVFQLRDCLSDIGPEAVIPLLQGGDITPNNMTKRDLAQISAVAFDYRGYESSILAIEKLVLNSLYSGSFIQCLSECERALLIGRVLQTRTWRVLSVELGLTGRKAVIAAFRQALGKLISYLKNCGR